MSETDQTMPAVRTAGVQTTTRDGELWVFDARHGQGHRLGPVAAAVWHAADGHTGVAGLVAAAQQVDPSANARLVWQVLDGLADADLLTARVAPAAPVVDRRAALGVLGAAAMAMAFGVRPAQAQDAPTRAPTSAATAESVAPVDKAPAGEAAPARADRVRKERQLKAQMAERRKLQQEKKRKQAHTEQRAKARRPAAAGGSPASEAPGAAKKKKQGDKAPDERAQKASPTKTR